MYDDRVLVSRDCIEVCLNGFGKVVFKMMVSYWVIFKFFFGIVIFSDYSCVFVFV